MIIYFFIALCVILITKIVTFKSPNYQIINVRKSTILSLIIVIIELGMVIVYLLIIERYIEIISQLLLLLIQSLFYFLLTMIVIFTIIHNNESLESIGITKFNLVKSCILGIILGIIFFVLYQWFVKNNEFTNFISIVSLISFINFLIVGFAEEIIFRGYLQIRLIAWQGSFKGCLLTAIIFSLYHLPNNLILGDMNLYRGFINCLNLIPLSLLSGYIMIKTKNITLIAILHTFVNWTLWR